MTTTAPYPPPLVPPGTDTPPDPDPVDDPVSPDVPDGGADDELGGLTLAEHAAILDAMTVVTLVCQEAARRALQGERPALEAEVTLTEQRVSEALTAVRPGRELAARLQGELEACQRHAAGLQAASDDDDVAARIRARSDRAAVAEESEAIRLRLESAHRAAEPAENAARQADHDLARTRADLASLDRGIKEPWATERGRDTAAYRVLALRTGLWAESDGPTARAIVDSYLRRGYGAQLERNAIAAYQAGQVRDAGDTKTWPNGQALINTGDVPVVVNGQAQPGDLAGVGPVQTSWPSGADASAGLRTAAGQVPPSVTKAASQEPGWIPSAIARLYR